ncbi:MAG: CehA/McbA family metallohydrolase [Firmicutes bacterium]|nr:CehA/McbA family metallohydrolase [Bacillota bacterium]
MKTPFEIGGRWFKCNFHSHSTRSDGRLAPEEVCERYRQAGYQVVALTDHGLRGYPTPKTSEGMLVIGSAEISVKAGEQPFREYHLIILGVDEEFSVSNRASAQQIVDAAQSAGALSFIAHPYWSGLVDSDIVALKGVIGLEVFNAGCEYEIAKGISRVHWDNALAQKFPVYGLAVDDGHHYTYDFGGGWVLLKAAALTRAAVLTALRTGMFYSTCGPEILDCRVRGDEIYITTSPVRSIAFVAHHSGGMQVNAGPGGLISEARYTLRPEDRYVRVECVDGLGRTAWTNPVWAAE